MVRQKRQVRQSVELLSNLTSDRYTVRRMNQMSQVSLQSQTNQIKFGKVVVVLEPPQKGRGHGFFVGSLLIGLATFSTSIVFYQPLKRLCWTIVLTLS